MDNSGQSRNDMVFFDALTALTHQGAPCMGRRAPQHATGGLTPSLPPHYSPSDGSLDDIIQLPFEFVTTLEENQPFHNHALLLEDEQPFNMAVQQPAASYTITPTHQQGPHRVLPSYNNSNSALPALTKGRPEPAKTRRPPLRKGTASYREAHIQSERQRRQEMAEAFRKLKSLLPSLKDTQSQRDRCTILGHVIEYVQNLDKKKHELGKIRAQLVQEQYKRKTKEEEVAKDLSNYTNNVIVRLCGNWDVFITLNCPKKRGVWPSLLALLQDTLQLDIQNVALSSTPLFCVHSIYAKIATNREDEDMSCGLLQKTIGGFVATHTCDTLWP